MSKWYGNVGYADAIETSLGIWEENIIEKPYYGDVLSSRWRRQNSGEVIDNINISNVISIVADEFANENCSKMIYVEYMGTKWKIDNVEVKYPRLILNIGGVYNGS